MPGRHAARSGVPGGVLFDGRCEAGARQRDHLRLNLAVETRRPPTSRSQASAFVAAPTDRTGGAAGIEARRKASLTARRMRFASGWRTSASRRKISPSFSRPTSGPFYIGPQRVDDGLCAIQRHGLDFSRTTRGRASSPRTPPFSRAFAAPSTASAAADAVMVAAKHQKVGTKSFSHAYKDPASKCWRTRSLAMAKS
jgi:hypothetical protein